MSPLSSINQSENMPLQSMWRLKVCRWSQAVHINTIHALCVFFFYIFQYVILCIWSPCMDIGSKWIMQMMDWCTVSIQLLVKSMMTQCTHIHKCTIIRSNRTHLSSINQSKYMSLESRWRLPVCMLSQAAPNETTRLRNHSHWWSLKCSLFFVMIVGV